MKFIIRDKQTGLYKTKKRYNRVDWTDNIQDARLYDRKVDCRNSVTAKTNEEWNLKYDMLPCAIIPEIQEKLRPNWQNYFLGLAILISKRSRDIHTQHGCIIVDSKTNHIIGTGYNSFPRKMKDETLPLNRPDPQHPELDDKYPWMIHSEVNACNNLTRRADEHTVAYITGEPCTPCLMHLWQCGITKVIHLDRYGSKHLIDEKTRKRRQILLDQTGMKVYPVKADMAWLKAVCLTI